MSAEPGAGAWECGFGRLLETPEGMNDFEGDVDVVGFHYRVTARREVRGGAVTLVMRFWCEPRPPAAVVSGAQT